MDKQILKQEGQDGYQLFRIPGIICTNSGKLLVYYECRKETSDWAAIDIAVKSSLDEGKTWSEDQILVFGKGKTVNNPLMFADGTEILFMWQEEYNRTFYRKSYDEGKTWGDATEITDFLKTPEYHWTVIACGPGHGTVLKNGRYIVPVWMCSNFADPKSHHPSVLSTIYSDDKGQTWHVGEIIGKDFFKDPSETALAELTDGQVMINIRHESPEKRRGIAFSPNGFDHWIDIHFDKNLPDPVCMGSMAAHNDCVYFTNCCSETQRENLTLYRTTDHGMTWNKLAKLSDPAGYSDIAVSPDGAKVYVFYEEFSSQAHNLTFTVRTVNSEK